MTESTGIVIHIRFSEDLPTKAQNELRCRMEMADWKLKMRKAREEYDYDAMDILDKQFDMLGMP